MRVLLSTRKSPPQRYLVHLFTKDLIREVRRLVYQKKHSRALAVAFKKGLLEREVGEEELNSVEADLILSRDNARWDLMKKL